MFRDPESQGITTGQNRSTRRRANGRTSVEPIALHALPREAIKVRCLDCGTPKAREVAVAKIVGQQQNDIRAIVRTGVIYHSHQGNGRTGDQREPVRRVCEERATTC